MTSPGRELEPGLLSDPSAPSRVAFETGSPAIQAFGRLLTRAARHAVPVLLLGERGTGKTTFARALHGLSLRAARPFIRVDCPVVTGDLSVQARAARRGTLFQELLGVLQRMLILSRGNRLELAALPERLGEHP